MSPPTRSFSTGQASPSFLPHPPGAFFRTCRRLGIPPTRFLLVVNVGRQVMWLFEKLFEQSNERLKSLEQRAGTLNKGDSRKATTPIGAPIGTLNLGVAASRQSAAGSRFHELRRSAETPLRKHGSCETFPTYRLRKRYLVSTSRFGVGQKAGSNQTPLGLHRIAEKIGGGQPIGTVFRSRQPVGLTWSDLPAAPIAHRILWLEGLEPSFNAGGDVDSHSRYIYIHGLGDETTLGRPASRGCIHLAAADLLPLFDRLPCGTLVWVGW